MSLDYTTLQSTVLSYAVHPELTTEVVQFIRACEASIKRDVRAFEIRSTIVEADRISNGVYNLSGQVQRIRSLFGTNINGDSFALNNAGLAGIRLLAATENPLWYAVSGQTIEFRGVPGVDTEFEIVYLGWPDALAITATNQLLTDHEDLYIYGTLQHLYMFTQDLELSKASQQTYLEAVNKINKLHAQLDGGGTILPAYNFGQIPIGRGY